MNDDINNLIASLRMRAHIRRNIQTRKSVQQGQVDRLAKLLDDAANKLDHMKGLVDALKQD